ncbi:hypothetical protein [Yoonia sediminilitoris]|uniref:Uncharacterized protein n=1 Tax=Yoonia sediminilitoris TaxID=1286148 RepID=A0A2T6KQG4_9RHOB|nr:hypothetical protein [Yoonia sediminilitoris]PUB18799.1 hypothetical protein C8N45_101386 [Yoonia sediminilitoris]RCW98967.1 hypothetical protein DFP92_101386 [Yoonia sediminilitoris]
MSQPKEPNLLRFYIGHCIIGFALSALFVGLLLWLDVAGLRSLIMGSDIGWLAVFLLWFFHGTIFGSVQFGVSIMLNIDKGDNGPRRGHMTPVRVKADSAKPLQP